MVDTCGNPAVTLDDASAEWIRALNATGAVRDAALARLHGLLVRAAVRELRRREAGTWVPGQELDDLAHQAAGDAMVALLGKLGSFRGESRFTTWAYRFVILEVSSELGRHYWRQHPVKAVRQAVDETLTEHQRRLFVAVVLNEVPLDALVARLGTNRNAVYKVIFDARRKIRGFLVANGYLEERRRGPS